MSWTIKPKTAREWIDVFFIIALLIWGLIVVFCYLDYRDTIAVIKSDEYENGMLKRYNEDPAKNSISFSKYKVNQTDSLLEVYATDLRRESTVGNTAIFLFYLFKDGWYISIIVLLLITVGIFVLWEFMKAPFYLREKMEAIDNKVELILSHIQTMHNRDMDEVFENELLDD